MIEGHVQFSGNGYRFYETLQPGLVCEDPENHSTCKAASEKRNAELSEAEKAERDAQAEAAKAEVEEAAKKKAEEDRQALINKAGVAKHDAKRIAGLALQLRQETAKKKAESKIAAAAEAYHKAVEEAKAEMDAEFSAAQAERNEREKEINATDWLAQVSPKESK